MKRQTISLVLIFLLLFSVSAASAGAVKRQTDPNSERMLAYVSQYWQEIVASLTATCRSTPVYNTMFETLAKAGRPFEGSVAQALEGMGVKAKQAIAKFLGSLVKTFARPDGMYAYEGKIIREAELVSKLVKKPGLWRSLKMGSASITIVLVVAVAFIAGTQGYFVGKGIVRQQHLEARAAENEAYANLLLMLAKGIRTGRFKLLPGVTFQKAVDRIRENLEIGRAPFINILEWRPCPDIAGTWSGALYVKQVVGQSNIQEGSRRQATFYIKQDSCYVTLRFTNNEIGGDFMAVEVLESAGQKMERDVATLSENPTGGLTYARLTIYGLGSGSLKGQMDVEIEQRAPNGAKIISGGRMSKSATGP